MQQRKKLVVAMVFCVVIVVSLFLAVSMNQIFLFSETVRVENLTYEPDTFSYSTSVTKDGETLANVYFRIEPGFPGQQQYHMLFSITPYSQTELDSLTLRFSAGTNILSIYKEATNSLFDGSQFYQKDYETIMEIPDTKGYGSSTIRLDFILESCDIDSLSVISELSMHQEVPFQLTSQKAQVYIDATVPDVYSGS